jgi:hypothetical protein
MEGGAKVALFMRIQSVFDMMNLKIGNKMKQQPT